jgi:WD40 repeat protein
MLFSNQTAELSFNVPISAIEAVRADTIISRFVVGTSSVRSSEDNYVHMIRFYHEANQLGIDATLSHPTGPVSQICTSPNDPSIVVTVAESSSECTIWKIPTHIMDQIVEKKNHNNDDDGDDDDSNYDENDNDDHRIMLGMGNNGGAMTNVTSMDVQATLTPSLSSTLDDGSSNNNNAKTVSVYWKGNLDEESASSSTYGDVLTLSADGTLNQWDVAFGGTDCTRQNTSLCNTIGTEGGCRWNLPPVMAPDPHHSDLTAVATGTKIQLIDWRESSSSSSSLSCLVQTSYPHHRYGIIDLDYNPNKPNMLTSSGKDGMIKFWDLRKSTTSSSNGSGKRTTTTSTSSSGRLQQPILVARGGHRHWVTKVRYNPFHDQLVLSAGTDSVVNLWRMSTISSAPLLTLEEEVANLIHGDSSGGGGGGNNDSMIGGSTSYNNAYGGGGGGIGGDGDVQSTPKQQQQEGPNVRVSRYEHMDSVRAIAWGAADAWVYVSGSYDGKVVLNHVPSKEKYKILL